MFGFVTLTTDFLITQWSEYLTALTGLLPGEVVGKDLRQLFPDLQERGIIPAIEHVMETGAPLSLSRILHRYVFPAKKGGLTEQSAMIHPITQADRVIGVVLNIQDVSDRSQIEVELRSRIKLLEALREIDQLTRNDDLEKTMQRTAELASSLLKEQPVHICLQFDGECRRYASSGEAPSPVDCSHCGICAELKRTNALLQIINPSSNPLVPPKYAGAQALIAVPLMENEAFLGSLTVVSYTTQIFSDAAEVLRPLARAAASALINHRMRQAEQNRVAELQMIYQVSTELRKAASQEEIIRLSVELAVRLLMGAGGMVLMPAKEPGMLQVVQAHQLPAEAMQMRFPIHGTLAGQAFLGDQPVMAPGIMARYKEASSFPRVMMDALADIPDWLFAPFTADTVLGVIAVGASAERKFTQVDLKLLATIAEIVAVAVQRSIHLEQAEQRARNLAVLNEVSQQLASVMKIDKAYSIVVKALTEQFHYALATITEKDEKTGELVIRAADGPEGMKLKKFGRLAPGSGITSIVMEEGRSQLINRVSLHPRYLAVSDLPPGSELCVPVFADQEIAAAISVEQPFENAFDVSDRDILMAMASHLGLALSNIRRHERITQTSMRLKEIDRALREVALHPEPGRILKTLLDTTNKLVPFSHGGVFLVDRDRHMLIPVDFIGVSPELEREFRSCPPSLADGLFAEVYRRRQPVEVADTAAEPRIRVYEGYTGSQLTCFPMVTGERVMALIDFDRICPDDEVRTMLSGLYHRGAIALQNALLYEETVRLSQQRGALLKIAIDFAAIKDKNILYQKILENTLLALDWDGAALGRVDLGSHGIEIVAVQPRNSGKPLYSIGDTLPFEYAVLADAVFAQKGAAAWELSSETSLLSPSLRARFAKQEIQSLLMAPLIMDGQPSGVLIGYTLDERRRFNVDDLTLAQGIASQAVVALQRVEFYEILVKTKNEQL